MQRQRLEHLLDEALAEDKTFSDTLREGGLLSKQTRSVRHWHASQLVAFQSIHDDISRMDTRILKTKKRRNSHRNIISHPQRAQDYYNRNTRDLQTESTRGIDALINYVIRLHDSVEEITNIEREANPNEELDTIRSHWVDLISERTLQRITLRAGGKYNVIDLFNKINIYTVIRSAIDKLTPYKKTRAKMSESYIDVLRLIFSSRQSESKEESRSERQAAYIAAIAKCYERGHNNRTMYADIPTVRTFTAFPELDRRISALEKRLGDPQSYRVAKSSYARTQERMRAMEVNQGVESLQPAGRIVELYKSFLLANEALKYLVNTTEEKRNKTDKALRERLLRGVEFLLETVHYQAERHAKALVVYQTIRRGSRNGNKDLHDILGADSEVELYKELEKAADEYLDSKRSSTTQLERGNTRETLFDGMLNDISCVERKAKFHDSDEKTRNETYATQTQFHLQDGIMLGKYAKRMLDDLRSGRDIESIKLVAGQLNLLLNP